MMKIRQGFVSNSSSTSFCIYGVHTDDPTERGLNEDASIYDELSDKAEKVGLTLEVCDDSAYLGLNYTDIKDDETGAQFKDRAKKLIEQTIPKNDGLEFDTYEECWQDG